MVPIQFENLIPFFFNWTVLGQNQILHMPTGNLANRSVYIGDIVLVKVCKIKGDIHRQQANLHLPSFHVWRDTNRMASICIASPKVAKAC